MRTIAMLLFYKIYYYTHLRHLVDAGVDFCKFITSFIPRYWFMAVVTSLLNLPMPSLIPS